MPGVAPNHRADLQELEPDGRHLRSRQFGAGQAVGRPFGDLVGFKQLNRKRLSGRTPMLFLPVAEISGLEWKMSRAFWASVRSFGLVLLFSIGTARGQIAASYRPVEAQPAGVEVHYQLPTAGPLPKTYRVTLAVVDAKDPQWIIGQFAAGVVRTVTAENKGQFTETWDGLDDNLMPVPPGTYGVKGIYVPAATWGIDGLSHTIVPKLASMGSSWGQTASQDTLPGKIEGDPCGSPLLDVDVAPGGIGSIYFRYLENGTNYFLTDFTKPIGYGQIITGYPSNSFAGGSSTCTDGKDIWSFSCDGGPKFIGRANGEAFGTQDANRHNVYLPEGWVTGMAAWADKDLGHSVVFAAERGRIFKTKDDFGESSSDFVDEIVALDGTDAHALATWKVERPLGVAARKGILYILHQKGADFEVSSVALKAGWTQAQPTVLFKIPDGITPFDIEADSHGRIYLSDSAANRVYQFDGQGNKLRTFGKLATQVEGKYDPDSFMAPQKLACWTDGKGVDRLLVVETSGPNRLSEWNGDDGTMIRQWVVPQTNSNGGYAVDPRHANLIYVPGQENTLVRWRIDYTSGKWNVDAVWFNVGATQIGLINGEWAPAPGPFAGKLIQTLAQPRLLYHGEDLYLAYGRGYLIYHFEGNHWRACAGLFRERTDEKDHVYAWRDLNGDGLPEKEEYLPFETTPPEGVLRYTGQSWGNDFSLVCIAQGTPDIWQLNPPTFDSKGTAIFDPKGWKKILTDNVFVAKAAGTAPAIRGGNEVGTSFSSDWAFATKTSSGDIYVSARSGPNLTANFGTQYKLSRYVPDGRGGFTQRWRVGRIALEGNAKPGEVYGPMYVSAPINGLVGVIDNSRAGVVLYTEDGLYVDTLFPDDRAVAHDQRGAYWLPAEFFSGYDYVNRDTGKIYFALGKLAPELYEAQGWSASENPVHRLAQLDKSVALPAGRISSPPEVALTLRGGPAAARVARFYPAPGGGPALDSSLNGWETIDPVKFQSSETETVEVRCAYDPNHLYLRWHVRLGHKFEPKPLLLAQHIFAHERGDDTLGFYLQGDPNSEAGGAQPNGRSGDVRFVFGIFKEGNTNRPEVLGMYPTWTGENASAQTYKTPVGEVRFAHVALLRDLASSCAIDTDGTGFVISAALPRRAIPGNPSLNGWKTTGNFDANLGGQNRFWWSNADGSASRETFDEPSEARLYPGSWSPVQFPPMDALPLLSWMIIGPFGGPGIAKLDSRTQKDELSKLLYSAAFPPDSSRDLNATYDGDMTQTREGRRKIGWQSVLLTIEPLLVNVSKELHWENGEGTAYFLTHIYSPQPADVILHPSHSVGQFSVTGQFNGKPLPTITSSNQPPQIQIDESRPLALQTGWNELLLRRDSLWSEPLFGGTLTGDPGVLWKLKISGRTPETP